MPRFFVERVAGEEFVITGEDAAHIGRVLRMGPGDELVVCETATDIEYFCKIISAGPDVVRLAVDHTQQSAAEPDVRVHLFQALPKADKMELIIQKAVELGVSEITPMLTRRCVSRPDEKSLRKKQERWQKIAQEAAKQCGRAHVPAVNPTVDFQTAAACMAGLPRAVLFYELGGDRLKTLLEDCPGELAIAVGAEGGFDEEEVALAASRGVRTATLGKRILRC